MASKRKLFISQDTPKAASNMTAVSPVNASPSNPPLAKKKRMYVDEVRDSLNHIDSNVDTTIRASLYSVQKGDHALVTRSLERLLQQNKAAIKKAMFHVEQLAKHMDEQQESLKTKDSNNIFLHRKLSDCEQKIKQMAEEKKDLQKKVNDMDLSGLFEDAFEEDENAEDENPDVKMDKESSEMDNEDVMKEHKGADGHI